MALYPFPVSSHPFKKSANGSYTVLQLVHRSRLQVSLSEELLVILHRHTGQLFARWNLQQPSSACLVLSRSTSWVYLFYCVTYHETKRNLFRPPSFCKYSCNWPVRFKLIAVGQTEQPQNAKFLEKQLIIQTLPWKSCPSKQKHITRGFLSAVNPSRQIKGTLPLDTV